MGSVSSHKHHPLLSLPSLSPPPFLCEWMLSTGAYLHRDGKGTKERKSILYLTTKHNPNQKQLEFAGCSINWTASSAWPLCRWIATVMHYSTMAWARTCQTQRYTHKHTHTQKKKILTHTQRQTAYSQGLGNCNSNEKNSREAGAELTNTLSFRHIQGKIPLDHLAHPDCACVWPHVHAHTYTHTSTHARTHTFADNSHVHIQTQRRPPKIPVLKIADGKQKWGYYYCTHVLPGPTKEGEETNDFPGASN